MYSATILVTTPPCFPTDTLHKYYLPFGFLPLASKVEAFSQLYQQVLLTLEPIAHLPFDLSIDFESKHVMMMMSLWCNIISFLPLMLPAFITCSMKLGSERLGQSLSLDLRSFKTGPRWDLGNALNYLSVG